MTCRIPDVDLALLSRANPDTVGEFVLGATSGRSTFFYGIRNPTLYIDDCHQGTHNIVLHEHPKMIEEILPTYVFLRFQAGEFFDPHRGSQTWEVVASFAFLGRLGGVITPW